MNMEDIKEKAKQIIESNIYMTLATASKSGQPWISPVFFVYDASYNLYWISSKESRHSNLVRGNNKVAIVIFDSSAIEGEGDAVYLEAEAEEMNDESEIAEIAEIWNKRATQEEFQVSGSDKVVGEAVWRIYRAKPYAVSKLGKGQYINGKYVDNREEISLK